MNSKASVRTSMSMSNSVVNYRKAEKKRKCKVLYSYQPLNDDELPLEVEDVVEILEEVEEGWWKGVLKGKVGVFPSNFVEELPATEEPAEIIAPPPIENKSTFNNEAKAKPIKGVGYGNIFQDGTIKLKPTAPPVATVAPTTIVQESKDDKPLRKSPLPSNQVTSTDAPELPPKKIKEQAKVLFSYEAQNDDELTLKEGDTVNVISKDIEDKGWWKGELNGTVGVFPDNFVQLIPTTDESRPKKPDRLEKDSSVSKNLKIHNEGRHHVDGNVNFKEAADSTKARTSSLTRGFANKNISSEITKKSIDEKVEKFDKMAAPPLPGKKPLLPPPLKKTTTPSNYRNLNFGQSLGSVVPPSPTLNNSSTPINVTNSKMNSECDKTTQEERANDSELDRVEISSEKLVHLTANRAKNPHRRPPSHVFLKGENEKPNGEVKNTKNNLKVNHNDLSKPLANSTNAVKVIRNSIPEIEERNSMKNEAGFKVSKDLEVNLTKSSVDGMKRHSPLPSPGRTKSIISDDVTVKTEKPPAVKSDQQSSVPPTLETLPQSNSIILNGTVKENYVLSSDYLKLKDELTELAMQFEMFKHLTNRHISELSNEVKLEKDKRLLLQAEMDTLKIQLQKK